MFDQAFDELRSVGFLPRLEHPELGESFEPKPNDGLARCAGEMLRQDGLAQVSMGSCDGR